MQHSIARSQCGLAAVFGHYPRLGSQQHRCISSQQVQRLLILLAFLPWRIEEDQAEASRVGELTRRALQPCGNGHSRADNFSASLHPGAIGFQSGHRSRRLLHKRHRRCAPAQRLNSHRSCAGIQVQHARLEDAIHRAVLEHVHQRLPQPIRRGPRFLTVRRQQRSRAKSSTDYTHPDPEHKRSRSKAIHLHPQPCACRYN